MKNSHIQWCDHTFNPWLGCAKVSEGCRNCYAEALVQDRLKRALWGIRQARVRTSNEYWKQPARWDREAAKAGTRAKVFCASLADVFDEEAPSQWLDDLFTLIDFTPNLTWLLLTKRPANIRILCDQALPAARRAWPPNIWLGTSVEDQDSAGARVPELIQIPARRHFVSAEPLLARVDLSPWLHAGSGLDWVIAGGESGPRARPADPAWFRFLLQQCQAAGAAFFFKQAGGRSKDKGGRILDGREWNETPPDA